MIIRCELGRGEKSGPVSLQESHISTKVLLHDSLGVLGLSATFGVKCSCQVGSITKERAQLASTVIPDRGSASVND